MLNRKQPGIMGIRNKDPKCGRIEIEKSSEDS